MAIDMAALDQAIAGVVDEIEHLGDEFVSWLDTESLQPWIKRTAAIAAIGLNGALLMRRRANRQFADATDEESSTWVFKQLQHSAG